MEDMEMLLLNSKEEKNIEVFVGGQRGKIIAHGKEKKVLISAGR